MRNLSKLLPLTAAILFSTSPASVATPFSPTPSGAELTWYDGPLTNVQGIARKSNRPVMIYFWRDGSEYCSKLYEETLTEAGVVEMLGDFVCYTAQHGTPAGNQLFERFGVSNLPSLVFLTPEGAPDDALLGYITRDGFVAEIERIREGTDTIADIRKRLEAAEKGSDEDFERRWQLADKLSGVGETEGAAALYESIRHDDPRFKTVIGARLGLRDLEEKAAEEGGGYEHLAEWDLGPLHKFARKVKSPKARFEAWQRLSQLEAERENYPKMFVALEAAWKSVPDEEAIEYGAGVANWCMELEGERTSKEKKFIVKLAEASVKLAEGIDPESDSFHERYGDYDYQALLASKIYTLSRAYAFTGENERAVQLAERCVELAPEEEEYDARLKSLRESI